jgi:hypothetical protein
MLKERPAGEHHGLATFPLSDNHAISTAFTSTRKADAGAIKRLSFAGFFLKTKRH